MHADEAADAPPTTRYNELGDRRWASMSSAVPV
jgi:hypothetical protein